MTWRNTLRYSALGADGESMQQPQSAKKLGYIYRHLPGFLIAAPYRLR
jgi:hypothetical protein